MNKMNWKYWGNFNRKTAGLKWALLASVFVIIIIGLVALNQRDSTATGEPRILEQTSLNHGHGMAYSSDGQHSYYEEIRGLRNKKTPW